MGESVVIAGSFDRDGDGNPTIEAAQVPFEVRQAGEAPLTPGGIPVDALTT